MLSVRAIPVSVLAALTDESFAVPGHHYHDHAMWGGGWVLGPVATVLTIALIAVVVVTASRWFRTPGERSPSGSVHTPETAMHIL